MALAETAKLATVLTLDDKLSPGLGKARKSAAGFGKSIKSGLGTATKVAAGVAVVGIGLVGAAIKTGLSDLATLETATTSVSGAIKTMGLTGQVTAAQVAGWANEIETDIGAAFDDKDITAATSNLIRFGKVTVKNLKPAMEVMTDLAAKTGSVESASTLLAKALADPEKAAGKLARQGIILTKAQEKQIKAFMKAGKIGKAQAVILDAVAKSTKGAAEASQGPYQRALSTLADVSEDARKALAEGFLPIIERVAKKLSKVLADPKAIQSIRDFGKGLAAAFDEGVKFVEGIDWGSVVGGLKSAAGWAKRLIDAFMSMPAEAKGLIIGLAGLSKLTGGAPIKIAVDLAKESLSGIFGHFFDRGASPANPLWVQMLGGPGGAGGAGGAAGATKGLIATVMSSVLGAAGVGLATLAGSIVLSSYIKDNSGQTDDQWKDTLANSYKRLGLIGDNTGNTAKNTKSLTGGQGPGRGGPTAAAPALTGHGGPGRGNAGVRRTVAAINGVKSATNGVKSAVNGAKASEKLGAIGIRSQLGGKLDGVKAKQAASLVAFRAGERATLGVKNTVASKLGAANAKLDAIRRKKTSFRTVVNVRSSVSVRNVNNSVTTSNRYGVRSMNQAL